MLQLNIHPRCFPLGTTLDNLYQLKGTGETFLLPEDVMPGALSWKVPAPAPIVPGLASTPALEEKLCLLSQANQINYLCFCIWMELELENTDQNQGFGHGG